MSKSKRNISIPGRRFAGFRYSLGGAGASIEDNIDWNVDQEGRPLYPGQYDPSDPGFSGVVPEPLAPSQEASRRYEENQFDDRDWNKYLIRAIKHDNIRKAERALRHGADPNFRHGLPMKLAREYHDLSFMDLLCNAR